MSDYDKQSDNPMKHPDEQPAGSDDGPHFGKLLVVLIFAVMMVGLLTFASEAYFS